MDLSLTGLRVLREAAERGTVTAAADALGYTQSAVSRQLATLERATGTRLFDRRRDGLRLTPDGRLLLRRARVALEEIDLATRELAGDAPARRVRLGVIPSAGVALLPRALSTLGRARPDLEVTSRVATTPALARALRAGSLDVAVVTTRPPHRPVDGETPAFTVVPLAEHELEIAVAADGPLGDRSAVEPAELVDQPWVVTPSRGDEPQLGAWPGLPGRARIAHAASDWATKLALVAAGCGITTVSPLIAPGVPSGVRIVPVADGPPEVRRIAAVHLPDRTGDPAVATVVDVLAAEISSAATCDAWV